jgi:hypothetical protein
MERDSLAAQVLGGAKQTTRPDVALHATVLPELAAEPL